MKTLFTLTLIAVITAGIFSQPLNGNYTIGGNSPDFVNLQDAANALKVNGVSSPVFFNIRPGTYSNNGGNNRVLLLDSIVAGLSASNSITFQPDISTGGNVDNVILEMNRTNINTTDPNLVLVKLDFITFRNLSFRHLDTLSVFANTLIRVEDGTFNTVVDDFVLDGCQFTGAPITGTAGDVGTDYGIHANQQVSRATIINNKFFRIRWAISIENGAGPRAGTIVVEDNEVYSGFGGGTAIVVAAEDASVRRNYVDFNGQLATAGIGVFFSSVAFVEQNIVRNAAGGTFTGIDIKGIFSIVPDSIIVANNIIVDNVGSTTTGMTISAANTKILNNTIVNPPTSIVNGVVIEEQNCSLINNIIINGDGGFFGVVLHLGNNQSAGLTSDHNIIFHRGLPGAAGDFIAFRDGNSYATILDYQSATGLDLNSASKQIEFISDSLGIYFDNCQVQDADLIGVPLPLVQFDYYDNARDPIKPFKGAVEGFPVPYDMFAAPFKAGLPGTAFSIAAGRFDNLLADGLAIPDYDNNQIHLYHNNFSTRTFIHSGTLTTEFQPTVVKFFDLDGDANLDLIVGGETETVKVFWGDGIGGFPESVTLNSIGRIRSIEIGKDNFFNRSTLYFTIDNGFLPNTSFVGYIINDDGRNISFALINQTCSPQCIDDTIYSVLTDLAIGNLDDNQDDEIAALSISIPSEFYIFNDTTAEGGGGFLTYGTNYSYSLGTSGYLGHTSSIVMDDFDGDSDLDLISTGVSTSSIIFIKNEGNFSFSSEEIPANGAYGLVSLDYENDGDPDLVTVNDPMHEKGLTVFLNDGAGDFTSKENCFYPFASGYPYGIVASDFDLDSKTDIAVVTALDSLFVLYNLGGGLNSIDDQIIIQIPIGFSISQNYPNPFNPTTTIEFSIPKSISVSIKVYDILGREVATLVNEEKPVGNYKVIFSAEGGSASGGDALSLSSGVYFYTLRAGNFVETKKMTLIK